MSRTIRRRPSIPLARSLTKEICTATLRPVAFYSYGTDYSPSAELVFRSAAAGHFGTTQQTSELGNGLYTDADPFTTMNYSGNPPRVLRVGVPAGVGYLDMRNRHNAIPAGSEDNANQLWCYLRNHCESDNCRHGIAQDYGHQHKEGWPSYSPTRFLRIAEPQRLLQQTYRKLGIEFVMGGFGLFQYSECKLDPKQEFEAEAVFINPDLAPRLQLNLITPRPTLPLTSAQRVAYEEFLNYLDAFSFQRDLSGTQFDPERRGETSAAENRARFEEWYAGILAATLGPLPVGTSAVEHQAARSEQLRTHRAQTITSKLFGCSSDVAYRDEAFPPL